MPELTDAAISLLSAAIGASVAWWWGRKKATAADPNNFERHNAPGEYSPDKTDEFSFMLRPSPFGIGVFATHPIAKGAALRLDRPDVITHQVDPSSVPGEFVKFCMDTKDGQLIRPHDFGHLETVWFLNHSDRPNAGHEGDYSYVALRDIAAGEEVLIDYGTL